MKTQILTLLILSLTTAGTVPPLRAAVPSPTEQERILAEVKPIMQAMDQACQRLDADTATKDFLSAPETIAIPAEGGIVDPGTISAGLKDLYTRLSSLKFTPIRDEYRVLAPDLVLRVWSYRVDGTSKKKGPWLIEPETASYLLRKSDGVWRCIFFQESSRPPKPLPANKSG